MVSINQNIFTPLASTNSVSPGASPSVSNTVSAEPDYSEVKELLKQSEEKVASAKKDLDEAEARLVKAEEHHRNFYNEAVEKYGPDKSFWPPLVLNESYQLCDFIQVCQRSVSVAQMVYDHALKTHEQYTSELYSLVYKGLSIPTASGSVTGSNNAPTPTTGYVPYYPIL